MANVSGEILINRPAEQVFDFVVDQGNEPIYNPRMLRSEKITEGPIGVGTRFRATARSGRRPVEMLIEVTEYQRATRFGSRTTISSVDVDGGLTFEPVAGGTWMSWSWRVRPSGPMRLLGPLVGSLGRRQEHRIWTGLKNYLEGSGRAGASTGALSKTRGRSLELYAALIKASDQGMRGCQLRISGRSSNCSTT
jgi:Polyketide cyclase / dehydrase and lipid transport